jgi:hypothetical protein
MKWGIFAYNYQWPDYVNLFDGWLARCSMAVPVIGYLILFNDSVSQHLSFNVLAHEQVLSFGLTSSTRLKLIYFGLIFLGSANIIYRIRRPYALKIGTDEFLYVETALKHFTASDYINVHGDIRGSGFDPYTRHGKYYDSEYDAFLKLAIGEEVSGRAGREPATANWAEAKSKFEGLLRSMLIENFFRQKVQRRVSLTICISLALIGYLLLLIPSADLFIKVMLVITGYRL